MIAPVVGAHRDEVRVSFWPYSFFQAATNALLADDRPRRSVVHRQHAERDVAHVGSSSWW